VLSRFREQEIVAVDGRHSMGESSMLGLVVKPGTRPVRPLISVNEMEATASLSLFPAVASLALLLIRAAERRIGEGCDDAISADEGRCLVPVEDCSSALIESDLS
jgi:hypothetical protein